MTAINFSTVTRLALIQERNAAMQHLEAPEPVFCRLVREKHSDKVPTLEEERNALRDYIARLDQRIAETTPEGGSAP